MRLSKVRSGLVCFACCACAATPQVRGQAQNVARFKFSPQVIRSDRTDPVVFEAQVTGGPSAVVFEYDGADRAMKDDGTGGDRVPGDGIYTLVFEAAEIVRKLTPADVFRPVLGFCKPLKDGSVVQRVNTIAEIWTTSIPEVVPVRIEADLQASENLMNIAGQVPLGNFDARPWAKKFYRHFGDDYDFLNFLILPALRQNRYHFAVKNTVKGIGVQMLDASGDYGSAGRLQGISVFPISSFFDGADQGYQHELGHQWINFLRGTLLEGGVPHWPISDLASGVMGYSTPGGQGLQFPFDLLPEGENYRLKLRADRVPIFNDLELYLMGLLPPEAVGKHFVFNDQSQQPRAGGLLLGPVREVSIGDLISVVGPRDPDSVASQKSFRIATIVVSDELLSAEAISFYDFFARRAELREVVPYSSGLERGVAKPFFVSTGGRGEIATRLNHGLLEPAFRRGDANPDGQLDLSDGVFLLNFLFLSGESPACLDSADTDDNGALELTDAIYLLNHLFLGGSPPPAPFGECGRDASGDGLGCGSYAPCR